MAKMAVLVPHPDMAAMAEQMFHEYTQITRKTVELIGNDEAADRARELAAEGCDVIMARGLQAKRIKRAVTLPVVELRVTAQELGLQVQHLKKELGSTMPKLAVIGFDNMLCDTAQFDELFGVELVRHVVKTDDDYAAAVRRAVDEELENGAEGIIGGNTSCRRAAELGLPCRFISGGIDSVREAFEMARHICYALDIEKKNHVELETVLDNTQSGILRLDRDGCVRLANTNAFHMLSCTPRDLMGKKVTEAFPALSGELVRKAMEGEETYTVVTPAKNREAVINIAPVRVDETVDGAILTLQEGRRVIEMNSELRHELYLRGFTARWRMEDLPSRSESAREMIRYAEKISNYSAPVLLTGEAGSGKELLAQAIHNAGITQGRAYVSLDCRAYQADTLDTLLFGTYSAKREALFCLADAAQNGTILLHNVEYLSEELQYKILRMIHGTFIPNGSNKPIETNVRILASTRTNLIARVEEDLFRPDLYYALSALTVHVSPLRSRKEDILDWTELYLKDWKKRYMRNVHLTQGARDALMECDWPGNLNQLDAVCERIVLLSEKRSVEEGFVRRQLEQLSPKLDRESGEIIVYRDEKAERIAALLKEHNGSREKVAREMGVSKTTLWRYMNKFGLSGPKDRNKTD